MPVYNFKSIGVVPTAKDFVDIVLSKTQRQTPTVVHNGMLPARPPLAYTFLAAFGCAQKRCMHAAPRLGCPSLHALIHGLHDMPRLAAPLPASPS